MDENLVDQLLHSFPNTIFEGIIREYDSGRSSSPVFAVRFRARNQYGLSGIYIVKIGPENWAAHEEAFYQHPSTDALTPLLARFHMPSQSIDNMTAVAYDVAFGSLIRPQPLVSILDEGSQSENEARQQIRDLCHTLVDCYMASDFSHNSIVSDPHALLYRLLRQHRMEDLVERLGKYLPFWKKDARHVNVEGLSTRLPNPIAYIQKNAWSNIRYNPHYPVGRIHGDLHTGNIICLPKAKTLPKVIDFGQSVPDGVPFFDLAYLEFDIIQHLLPVENVDYRKQWLSLLKVSMANVLSRNLPRGWQAARAWKLIQPIRQQVKRLQEVDPESYEIVWWFATVAVGLNFARKGDNTRSPLVRMSALLYAAYGLARLLEILHVEDLIEEHAPFVPWIRGDIPRLISPKSLPPAAPIEYFFEIDMPQSVPTRTDWIDAPNAENFYGREVELAELERCIVDDRCRVMAVLGIGGIGKTSLITRLVGRIGSKFNYVFGRSLVNAPSLESISQQCIHFLSNQEQIDLPTDTDSLIALLLQYFQTHRCLLVLDNMETILKGGAHAGHYLDDYVAYEKLTQKVGETKHLSCLLITSREKPKAIDRLEGKTKPVRSIQLPGLGPVEGQKLLTDKDIFGSDEIWTSLTNLYSGNPLALKIVSGRIRGVFRGDIARFLKEEGGAIPAELHDLLNQQFERLTTFEQEIMYWLAIEREAIPLEELRKDLILSVSAGEVLVLQSQLEQKGGRMLPGGEADDHRRRGRTSQPSSRAGVEDHQSERAGPG